MRRGEPLAAFAWAVAGRRGWSWRERIALLRVASRWRRAGFRAMPGETVADLASDLPAAVRRDFIEPLCVAALNTPTEEASGAVFLRVLRDALVGSPGSADLLLPRVGLGSVFPAPALAWLERNGATIRLAHRVERIERDGAGWRVDGGNADRIVIAASAVEAARLVGPHAAAWAAIGRRLALRADRHRLCAQRRLHPAGADARAPRRATPDGQRNSSSIAAGSAARPGRSPS